VSDTKTPGNETTDGARVGDQFVVPLAVEELSVSKEKHETGRVRVSTVTHEHEEMIDEPLERQAITVETIPIGKQIEAIPAVREEGDLIVVPIVEEVLIVERQLFLKEEVHIRRLRETDRHQERVILRSQEAVVTRLPVEAATDSKSARIVEEVVIGKEGSEHVETVTDKVGRQQVQVERVATP
jgi:uncharacterized protein (TIGR02271 family)